MNFVDGNRRLQRLSFRPRFHPLFVGPLVFKVPDHGCGAWRLLVQHAKRIGLLADMPFVVGNDVVLVQRALADSRHKAFPDAGTPARPQGMRLRVPTIEVADHRNRAGVGRPNSKVSSRLSRDRHEVRAQLVVNPVVGAFVEKMEVLIGQQRGVAAGGRG